MRCNEVADQPFPDNKFFGRDIGDRGRCAAAKGPDFMQRNAKNSVIQWTAVVVFLIGLPLCILIFSALFADARRYRYSDPMLVGVWRGDSNNVFELRADGTGRGFIDSPNNMVSFRWQERNGTFTQFYEPETKSVANKVELMIRGLPNCACPTFDVVNADATTLQLIDNADGGKLVVLSRSDLDEFLPTSNVGGDTESTKQKATEPSHERIELEMFE